MQSKRITLAALSAALLVAVAGCRHSSRPPTTTKSVVVGPATETPDGTFPEMTIAAGPFVGATESLKTYQYPAWFRDAKLGIWAHWGPQAVPMEGDWYARKMYQQDDGDYKDHLARFGHPSEPGHGYKDIIPLWKAEKWDPDALMKLYKQAGARYFVAQAVHHDNFDNWNSTWHKWNSVKMGPMRDVVGDWQKAAAKQGLRFGVSEHLAASFTWFQVSHGSDKTGPYAGKPYDGADPAYADLYHWPAAADDHGWTSNDPRWQAEWYARIKDLVDQYHPDLLYSDCGLPFSNDIGRNLIADLYNVSAARHGGTADAVYNCKQDSQGQWVQDVERGVMGGVNPYPWQTDTSIGDWFYNKHWKYRDAQWVVHSLVDIVSKNGNLLINVVQRPDGSLDPDAVKVVDDLGKWMAVNNEGIYGTRPWMVYGEGKRRAKGGAFNEDHTYTAEDIRFTTKGEHTLYAFAMGWPADGKLQVHSLAAFPGITGRIRDVHLLGHAGALKWTQTADALVIDLPSADAPPCDFAYGLKIDIDNLYGFKPSLAPSQAVVAKPDAAGNLDLKADTAELGGGQKLETQSGQLCIGYWDNPADGVVWTALISTPGTYKVTAEVAAANGASSLAVEVGKQQVHAAVPSTAAWDAFTTIELGTLTIGNAGQTEIVVKAADPKAWNAVNLRGIKLVLLAK